MWHHVGVGLFSDRHPFLLCLANTVAWCKLGEKNHSLGKKCSQQGSIWVILFLSLYLCIYESLNKHIYELIPHTGTPNISCFYLFIYLFFWSRRSACWSCQARITCGSLFCCVCSESGWSVRKLKQSKQTGFIVTEGHCLMIYWMKQNFLYTQKAVGSCLAYCCLLSPPSAVVSGSTYRTCVCHVSLLPVVDERHRLYLHWKSDVHISFSRLVLTPFKVFCHINHQPICFVTSDS